MMSEQCACGAAIQAKRYWHLAMWRETHLHDASSARTEPGDDIPGPFGTDSRVETAHPRYFEAESTELSVPVVNSMWRQS